MYDTLASVLTGRFQVRPELLSPTATPAALGLDSLFAVELSIVLEEDSGLVIDHDELADAPTLADIARLMQNRAGVSQP
ncbi:acyl carrier protein [Kitasatospora sp. NPDC048540]|uniref:acyl carrier protein n=1 Tax=unclassified Kitasatospora TaxID=2633591 RepID=UPI00053B934C|nr:acyl carrier protein [Kitasatospora sp. MBT63]